MTERIEHLLKRYLSGLASEAERAELFLLVELSEDAEIEQCLAQAWDQYEPKQQMEDSDKVLREILLHKAKIVRPFKWMRVAVAAIFILVIAGATILYFNQNEKPQIAEVKVNDIPAGKTGAILTLSDGKVIVLDSVGNGTVADGFTKVSDDLTVTASAVEYATLTTPKARTQMLSLSDGTKLWLNAASSIRFPTTFKGTREVEITGEAYFEVAKNEVPFIVHTRIDDIRVLGTHFNIMAYEDEGVVRTTLLEGSVEVKNQKSKVKIVPGEQYADGVVIKDADVEQVVAWKNGVTAFHNADLATIMRAIERWYDVTVEVEGKLPKRSFFMEVSRNAKLSELLKVFELNKIKYEIDGTNKVLKIK